MDVEIMDERGSISSASHLLSSRFRQTSKRNKMIASALLTVTLISGSVGFIHMYNQSNGDVSVQPLIDNGQDFPSQQAFILRSSPEEKPTPAALTQEQVSASTTQGSTLPSVVATTAASGRTRKKGEKQLPADAQARHPVSLIYEMKTNPIFNFVECKDGNTTLGFKTELHWNKTPEVFLAYGRNKKQAKRIAAEQACSKTWNLTYPFEDVPERNDIVSNCPA